MPRYEVDVVWRKTLEDSARVVVEAEDAEAALDRAAQIAHDDVDDLARPIVWDRGDEPMSGETFAEGIPVPLDMTAARFCECQEILRLTNGDMETLFQTANRMIRDWRTGYRAIPPLVAGWMERHAQRRLEDPPPSPPFPFAPRPPVPPEA